MNTNIKPTIGRIVWYRPGIADAEMACFNTQGESQPDPLAATIIGVHSPTHVNLSVCDTRGRFFARIGIRLVQDGEVPPPTTGYCHWMPYQQNLATQAPALQPAINRDTPLGSAAAPAPRGDCANYDVKLVKDRVYAWTPANELAQQLSTCGPEKGLRIVGDMNGVLVEIAVSGTKVTTEEIRARQALSAPRVIELTPQEVQSGLDRVRLAEGLIKQLPANHGGRNSWLLNYGSDAAALQADWAERNPNSSLVRP